MWVSRDRLASLLDAIAGRGDVRLSFDDGNLSDVSHALPELRRRGLRATFVVVAGRLGATGFLSGDDLLTLRDAGMTIGSHGLEHRPWRSLGERELRDELYVARLAIERIVGWPGVGAACPFGSYDRRVLRSLRAHGYRRVFTSDGGPARSDWWLQPRTSVHQDGGGELERMLVGWWRQPGAPSHTIKQQSSAGAERARVRGLLAAATRPRRCEVNGPRSER